MTDDLLAEYEAWATDPTDRRPMNELVHGLAAVLRERDRQLEAATDLLNAEIAQLRRVSVGVSVSEDLALTGSSGGWNPSPPRLLSPLPQPRSVAV